MTEKPCVMRGWRLKLFNKLLKEGMITVKNHKLEVTDKFMKVVDAEMRKRKPKRAKRT